MKTPKNFQICYSSDDIDGAVNKLGVEISKWTQKVWEDSHTDVIAVPILRGGIFFFADLVRAVQGSVEIAPIKAWSYVEAENAKMLDKVKVDVGGISANGRRVLLVDDICDSGRTLAALKTKLMDAGALEVRSAVLIKRDLGEKTFDPDWIGFSYKGPEWFVGYGMEDSDRWRNLGAVYIIKQS
ncbi:MAG: phosphoribosyltransferase family protein [bacterium]|nr:phosphoribosyltransferase family protein [bacterium]